MYPLLMQTALIRMCDPINGDRDVSVHWLKRLDVYKNCLFWSNGAVQKPHSVYVFIGMSNGFRQKGAQGFLCRRQAPVP